MLHSIRFLALLGWVLACQGVFAADGVFPGYIVVGQNITLQAGKNEYGVAVQEGVLVMALNLAGKEPTRESLVRGLHKAASLDINGLRAKYTEDAHTGMTAVDLSIVTQEGKFRH